jgi:hypothetical protein
MRSHDSSTCSNEMAQVASCRPHGRRATAYSLANADATQAEGLQPFRIGRRAAVRKTFGPIVEADTDPEPLDDPKKSRCSVPREGPRPPVRFRGFCARFAARSRAMRPAVRFRVAASEAFLARAVRSSAVMVSRLRLRTS